MDEISVRAIAKEYADGCQFSRGNATARLAIERAFISGTRLVLSDVPLLGFVRSFIREWEATWIEPDEASHEWAGLYTEAKQIVKAVAGDTSEEEATP